VKAFYDQHPERFKQPDLVSVRHILVTVKKDPKDQAGLTDDDAKARISKIQEELKGGTKFEDLAKKYSDDPGSKENGGLYADADPSGWVPEFGAAARTQPVGEVGAPVKTSYGYHLIKVESRKPSRLVPFEEAKEPAEKMAQQDRQAKVWKELMDELRKEIPFEVVKPAPAPKAAAAPKTPQTAPVPAAPETPVAGKGEVK
jgi:parvulin-like peptidyl-prolyl isomerase